MERWGDVMILACRSDLRVPGLGTALVKEGLSIMEERGIKVKYSQVKLYILTKCGQVFTGTATSHFSGRIFQKLGFQEISAQSFDEYKVDGEVVFLTSDPHTHARQFVLN